MKYVFSDEPNPERIEEGSSLENELHEFQCENCGFTLFPARGREGKFFPDNFKCMQVCVCVWCVCLSLSLSFFLYTDTDSLSLCT